MTTETNLSSSEYEPESTTATTMNTTTDKEDVHHSSVGFSETVDRALEDVNTSMDEFDSTSFNTTEYINKHFPNEQALGNLDSFMKTLKVQIQQVDRQILDSVRSQSTAGNKAQQDLAETKSAIQTLFSKIKDIQDKAEKSESMVHEICADIKSLDYARHNLTTSIRTLNNLKMIVSTVSRLKELANEKQYRKVAESLEAVNQLCENFEGYESIPKIQSLLEEIESIKSDLKTQVLNEFASINQPSQQLADACLAADALGPSVRDEIVKKYVKTHIREYKHFFPKNGQYSDLENIPRRFSWIRRALRSYRESFEAIFPSSWCVPQEICTEFCLTTRQHVSEYLNEHHNELSVSTLLRAVKNTLQFEKELQHNYGTSKQDVYYYQNDKKQNETDEHEEIDIRQLDLSTEEGIRKRFQWHQRQKELEKLREQERQRQEQEEREQKKQDKKVHSHYRFPGLISTAYEDYMDIYVESEDRQLEDTLKRILSEEQWQDPIDRRQVLSSSRDLVLIIASNLQDISGLSSGKTLLALAMVWKKHLSNYAHALTDKIPKSTSAGAKESFMRISFREMMGTEGYREGSGLDEGVLHLNEGDVIMLCNIINSAQYCIQNVNGLEERLSEAIDEEHRPNIDYGSVADEFQTVISRSIKALVSGIQARLDSAFADMTRQPWSTWTAVGDQSEYVTAISQTLSQNLPYIAGHLSATHYRFFCDKFIAFFVPHFIAAVYKCKRISEQGAQQLLLDVRSLQSFLRDLPHIDDAERLSEASLTSFHRVVEKEVHKVERLLKLLLARPENLAESYYENSKDPKPHEIQKIMDLKGMKRAEQNKVLEALQRKATGMASQQSNNAGEDSNVHGDQSTRFMKLFSQSFNFNY